MRADDQIADFYLFFAELGVPDPHGLARRALDLGFAPAQKSKFAETIQSKAVGCKTLTEFFTETTEKTRPLAHRLGFSYECVRQYRLLAQKLVEQDGR